MLLMHPLPCVKLFGPEIEKPNIMCKQISKRFFFFLLLVVLPWLLHAQIGKRFPSERKEIRDTITGSKLIFLTSTPAGDSKIYQTHNQWTSDGQWLIFRS